jgi:hypothetical protein
LPSLGVPPAPTRPTLHLYTDASQSGETGGLGGYLHGYFWHATLSGLQKACIAELEFFALVISVQTFQPHMGMADVVIHVDNQPVVAVVASGIAHSESTRRCHALWLALNWWQRRSSNTQITYIRSAGNVMADALSRSRIGDVALLCQAAHVTPREVPAVGGGGACDALFGVAAPAPADFDLLARAHLREARAFELADALKRSRAARRNPSNPMHGRRIGETSNPGPAPAAADAITMGPEADVRLHAANAATTAPEASLSAAPSALDAFDTAWPRDIAAAEANAALPAANAGAPAIAGPPASDIRFAAAASAATPTAMTAAAPPSTEAPACGAPAG